MRHLGKLRLLEGGPMNNRRLRREQSFLLEDAELLPRVGVDPLRQMHDERPGHRPIDRPFETPNVQDVGAEMGRGDR